MEGWYRGSTISSRFQPPIFLLSILSAWFSPSALLQGQNMTTLGFVSKFQIGKQGHIASLSQSAFPVSTPANF